MEKTPSRTLLSASFNTIFVDVTVVLSTGSLKVITTAAFGSANPLLSRSDGTAEITPGGVTWIKRLTVTAWLAAVTAPVAVPVSFL